MRCVIVLGLLLSAFFASAEKLTNDILATPFYSLDGTETSIANFNANKPKYIKFWATWCQPCIEQMAHLEQSYQQFGSTFEFIIVNLGVNDDLSDITNSIAKHKLTMPIYVDQSGKLAQALNMIGTPTHLLIDRNNQVIHRGHDADSTLNNKFTLLSSDPDSILPSVTLDRQQVAGLTLSQEPSVLYFSATWCDWYFATQKPPLAKACVTAEDSLKQIRKTYPTLTVTRMMSRLWTGQQELNDYQQRFGLQNVTTYIDKDDALAVQFNVKQLPSFVLINQGKVVLKTNDPKKLTQHLSTL